MKLSLNKGNVIISSKSVSILLGDNPIAKPDNYEIIISNTKLHTDYNGVLINSPGEYEAHGVMIQALPIKGASSIDLISIDLEGVNIIYLSSSLKLPTKKLLDQLGINHILILNEMIDAAGVRDILDEFEPLFLIPKVYNNEDLLGISRKLGLNIPEVQTSFVLLSEDISQGEEVNSLNLVLLKDL